MAAAAAWAVPAVLTIAGTALSAKGARQQGKADRAAAEFQADQLDQQAGQEQAAAQRVAADQARITKYAESRALAVAAASGAGASGRTVSGVISKIAQEGAYRSALALYQGDSEARQMRVRAQAARETGVRQDEAYSSKAYASVLTGGSSLFGKYGKNIPSFGGGGGGSFADGSSFLDAGSGVLDTLA